jgi:hypothetical protein
MDDPDLDGQANRLDQAMAAHKVTAPSAPRYPCPSCRTCRLR